MYIVRDVGVGMQIFWGSYHFVPSSCSYVLSMPHIWLKQDNMGAQWSSHVSISAVTRFLGEWGVKLYDTSDQCKAKCDGCRKGWCFSTDPNDVVTPLSTPYDIPDASPSLANMVDALAIQCITVLDSYGSCYGNLLFKDCSVWEAP